MSPEVLLGGQAAYTLIIIGIIWWLWAARHQTLSDDHTRLKRSNEALKNKVVATQASIQEWWEDHQAVCNLSRPGTPVALGMLLAGDFLDSLASWEASGPDEPEDDPDGGPIS